MTSSSTGIPAVDPVEDRVDREPASLVEITRSTVEPHSQSVPRGAPVGRKRRAATFVTIGVVNTAVAYSCFAVLYLSARHWPYMAVLVVSREVSVVFAYVLYRHFVFGGGSRILPEFARFWLVYAGALVLNLAALPFAVEILGLPVLAAQAGVTALAIASSWIGHSRFSFRHVRRT